ncbi:hypothetical protein B2J93_5620 [Marssonina coronariae]|uniref:Uncharacterized protein n=1 Tax=Diplocarpon coronariae TaxID=2795749 RepID=A0A218ZBI6_9HELO|nr:hypothetical protein B2J93_5620 [Marssonina coronariae]
MSINGQELSGRGNTHLPQIGAGSRPRRPFGTVAASEVVGPLSLSLSASASPPPSIRPRPAPVLGLLGRVRGGPGPVLERRGAGGGFEGGRAAGSWVAACSRGRRLVALLAADEPVAPAEACGERGTLTSTGGGGCEAVLVS